MYESLFGLTGLPFQLSPDTSFLFEGKGHRQALLALRQGLASAFAGMQAVMQRRELESEELNVAQSTLTHAASHAGVIRFQVQNILAGA